nr:MAG TPA: hypothetical protein [Siphoviridae sp. ctdzB12]
MLAVFCQHSDHPVSLPRFDVHHQFCYHFCKTHCITPFSSHSALCSRRYLAYVL